jgi:dTDP-4-dehydrorhamnose reductase
MEIKLHDRMIGLNHPTYFIADIAANRLVEILLAMLELGLCGLYHVDASWAMSQYQFGVEITRRSGFRKNQISPQYVDQSCLTARFSHHLWLSPHKLSTGLVEFYTQYQQDYPQKIRSYA